MGTQTGGDGGDKRERLLKLQARRAELEAALSARNEELYRLCVREGRLTGVLPPEVPAAPPRAPRPVAPPEPPRSRPLHRETHFSSSHPELPRAPPQVRTAPLLYQYASQLKAQSRHLGTLPHHHPHHPPPARRRPEGVRRNTLQRTQTYHLTSHSDYTQHLENLSDVYRQPAATYQHGSQPNIQDSHRDHHSDRIHVPTERIVPNTLPLRERNAPRNLHVPLQVSTEDYMKEERRPYPDAVSPLSHLSGYSQGNFDSVSMNKFSPLSQNEGKLKEKHWYETSLDSPIKCEVKNMSSLKRTSSVGNSQAYEIMMSTGRNSALQSPNVPLSPPVMSPGAVSLESPKNLTVIEQGKCIPYREESKPFEMSDFYKYSTKFRQGSQKPGPSGTSVASNGYNKLPMELPQYATREHWPPH